MSWLGWVPDLQVLDLWVWGALVAPVVLVGIPILLATVRVPRALAFEEVPDAELSEAQRRWFEGLGERLRGVGYENAVTFRAVNLPSQNLSRAWVSGMDGSVALAMAIRDERQGSVMSDNLVEFNTEFGDGSFVNTRSTSVTDLFHLLPGCERHIHYTRDPLALKRHHDRHCRAHDTAAPRPVQATALLTRMGEFHQRWIAHQIDRGLLRVVDAESCGATLRLALRGIASFFNPFGDRFSLPRMLAGLAAGLAVPLVAAFAVTLPPVYLTTQVQSLAPMSNHMAEILTLVPVFLLASAGVGWIFESRAVVWAPLLASLAGWLALPSSTPDTAARAAWLLVLIGTSLLANSVSNLRHRRQALI
jgi:hypothetical protein